MATVIRENVGLLNDKITVKISKEDYYPSFEKAIKDYSKKANIPGFRKGMVPPGMVKKMYGASIFYDEVVKVVEKQIQEYLTSEKPEIFAQPLPLESDLRNLDMNSPSDYDFPFEIGLKPVITIPDLNNANVTLYKVGVTDQMVSEEIEQLQKRYGKTSEPETITSEENVLKVSFVETDIEGNPLEDGIVKDTSLPVKYFKPFFREQLMGKGMNDSIQLQLNDAFEDKEREWLMGEFGIDKDTAGMLNNFKLTITNISLVENRELNEEFFNIVFPGKELKGEDEFRNEIKHDLQEHWNAQSNVQLQDQVYHILLDTPMDFPEEFLKKWMQKGGDKEKSPEEIEAEYPTFKNQLKWTLISEHLIQKNNIEVTPEELRAYMYKEIMQYFGQANLGGDTGWIESYVDRMMKDQKHVDNSYRRLITDKLFTWVQSQVNPVEKEITAEELTSMQHHHHH